MIPWRRKWQPTPVSLPRKSHGQKSLVGCSPWGRKESGTTEWLTLTYFKYLCSFCGLFFFFFAFSLKNSTHFQSYQVSTFSPHPLYLFPKIFNICLSPYFRSACTWDQYLKKFSQKLGGFSIVLCCCSVAKPFLTLCSPTVAAHQASLSFTVFWSSQIHVHWVGDAI